MFKRYWRNPTHYDKVLWDHRKNHQRIGIEMRLADDMGDDTTLTMIILVFYTANQICNTFVLGRDHLDWANSFFLERIRTEIDCELGPVTIMSSTRLTPE